MPQAEREQIQDPIKRHECWKEFHSEQLNLKLWESGTNLIQNIHPISISGTRNMFQDHAAFFELPQN